MFISVSQFSSLQTTPLCDKLPDDASNLRHGRLSAIMANVNDWPFNPNFSQAFSFPAFGMVEWLALACGQGCEGNAAKITDARR